jgi:hypothetical protein
MGNTRFDVGFLVSFVTQIEHLAVDRVPMRIALTTTLAEADPQVAGRDLRHAKEARSPIYVDSYQTSW